MRVPSPFAPFIAVIQRAQKREGISDAAQARKLGVSGAFWSLLQNDGPNGRSPGAKFILGAFQAYPHTHDQAPTDACVACEMAAALGQRPGALHPDHLELAPLLLASHEHEAARASA